MKAFAPYALLGMSMLGGAVTTYIIIVALAHWHG